MSFIKTFMPSRIALKTWLLLKEAISYAKLYTGAFVELH